MKIFFYYISLFIFCIISLLAWSSMPMYPDEVAFRIQTGRFIQDNGILYGLYAFCESNIKSIPLFFSVPAYLLSFLDLNLSLIQYRIIKFTIVVFSVFTIIYFSYKSHSRKQFFVPILQISSIFIGVAGSGLVLARHEVIAELNILICILSFIYLKMFRHDRYSSHILFSILVISCLASVYVHPQGLLWVPLSFLICFLLIKSYYKNLLVLAFICVLFFITVLFAIKLSKFQCSEYSQISNFLSSMVINLNSISMKSLFYDGLLSYSSSFEYQAKYAINYLPSYPYFDFLNNPFVFITNILIRFISIFNLIALSLLSFIILFYLLFILIFNKLRFYIILEKRELVLFLLLGLPIIFLFCYDISHNFYRNFFINFISVIAISLFIIVNKNIYLLKFFSFYAVVCLIVALASLIINVHHFYAAINFNPRFVGPSISLLRYNDSTDVNIKKLVNSCNIEPANGGIIVDDLTFNYLKSYPKIYPMTYLALQSDIIGLDRKDSIKVVHANYALARCDLIADVYKIDIPEKNRAGDLCCINFIDPN